MSVICSPSLVFCDLGDIDIIEPGIFSFFKVCGFDRAVTRARKLDVNEEVAYAKNGVGGFDDPSSVILIGRR